MSDFRWHKGEPPKDGNEYFAAYSYYFDVVEWCESNIKSLTGWVNARGEKSRPPEAWAEIPPVDWDALEEK